MYRNTFILVLVSLTIAAACRGAGAGKDDVRRLDDLARIQSKMPFEIVLPRYLPEGIYSPGIAESPFNDKINRFVDVWYFDSRGVRGIRITEGIPLPRDFYPLDRKWEYKTIKEVRVQVVYGGFSERRLPDGSVAYLEGVEARWNHNGVSFYLTTVGLLWDEAEKVVASMIE
ncbi:MAG: hypothetical protein HY673_06585 [Chloroflexi bacterium]|nr:hypothetical protein [Chloroflexota bacterium]